MKICSVCRSCYGESVAVCDFDDGGSLIEKRNGDCFSVEGYKIEKQIESETYFEIYRALHLESEKNVLIRFIKTADSGDELQKEIESVAAINHPNLARVYEFGKISGDEFYIVLEDVSAENLRDYLQENSPLKERFAVKIARQIAEALEELHSKTIVHRAVSPANIYFSEPEKNNFEVKLQNYDFGALQQKKVVKGANGIGAKTEIFRYYSPEQLRDEAVDFKSDIYSLAIVFYEMLLGRSPYEAINPQAVENYIFNESDVMKLHFDLRALIGYALRQSLQHRLHLRPPTTNNLSRQYRHLELVATPHDMEAQKDKNKQPKAVKNVSVYQALHAKKDDNEIFDEDLLAPPIIENDTESVFVENQPDAEILQLETVTGHLPFRQDFEPVEILNQSADVEINPEKIIEEIGDETKLAEVNFAEETGIEAAENLSENIHITNEDIHITNRETVEEIGRADLSPVLTEIAEPEFVEENVGEKPSFEKTPARNFDLNSFDAYSRPSSFEITKTHLYAGGVLMLILLGIGGAVVVSNSSVNRAEEKNIPSSSPANVKIVEQTNSNFEKTDQIADENESDVPASNQTIIKTGFEQNAADDLPVKEDIKAAPERKIERTSEAKSAKPVEKPTANTKPVKTVEKETVKSQPNKKAETTAKAEKTKPPTNNSTGMTRPRIVTNVKSDN